MTSARDTSTTSGRQTFPQERRFLRETAAAVFLLFAITSNDAIAGPVSPASLVSCAHPTLHVEWGNSGVRSPPASKLVQVDASQAQSAVLVVEEQGEDLEEKLDGDDAFHAMDVRPPRYGVFAAPVKGAASIVLQTLRPHSGGALVRLACSPSEDIKELPACLGALSQPAVSGEGSWCSALRLHAAASTASKAGDSLSALALYRQASEAWKARDDRPRAGAALLGATEALVHLGRYADAVNEASLSEALSKKGGSPYFALRAHGEACLSQRDLGDRAIARRCLALLPAGYQALGETGDAANADYNLGSMADEDGDWRDAARWLGAARKLDLTHAPADIVGRLDILAASLDEASGKIGSAVRELDHAIGVFEGIHNGRWVANAELRLARLDSLLGAWEESRLFARDALDRLPEDQAAKRRAEVFRALARIAAHEGNRAEAATDLAEARRLLGNDTPLERRGVDLDEALLLGDQAAAKRGHESVVAAVSVSEQDLSRLVLIDARTTVEEQRIAEASVLLSHLREEFLAPRDRLALCALQAAMEAKSGRANEAYALLIHEIARVQVQAASTSAAGLRYLLGQHLLELRRAWLDVYLDTPLTKRPAGDVVMDLLQRTQPESLLGLVVARKTPASPEAVDRELAHVLLADASAPGSADANSLSSQRALIHHYASAEQDDSSIKGTPVAVSASPKVHLPPGTVMLAFGFGTHKGVAVATSSDNTTISEIASPAAVREAAGTLRDAVASRETPIQRIDALARSLSGLLFHDLPASPPTRLWLMPGEEITGVPYSVLSWPGQEKWLVETTSIRVLPQGLLTDSTVPLVRPKRIDVLVAANETVEGSVTLPDLPGAREEPQWIAASMPSTDIAELPDADDARSALIARLQTQNAWIHLAAHGSARPGLQSYSGVWLSKHGAAAPPEMFSWLDAAESQARARLVVLDACALAQGDPRASEGASTFASALSVAGVGDVVAALWPVSDAAGAVWVPAFYVELNSRGDADVAEAVRQAQLHLKDSIVFRHPFYWASLINLHRS